MTNPEYFTIEEMKNVGMWPLSFLSGWMMVPYIKRMKGNVVGLEIGVLKGETAFLILENCPNVIKYYGVDPYKEYVDNGQKKEQWQMDLFKETASKNLSKFPHYSLVETVPEDVDFILIDGDHSYEQVTKDLETYYPRLKNGGMIFCHDYNNENVMRAITDWRKKNRVSQPIMVMPNFLWSWVK